MVEVANDKCERCGVDRKNAGYGCQNGTKSSPSHRFPTAQDRIKALLERSGIPAKEIKVFGSQIIITALSLNAANRWALLLKQFCTTVRKPVESLAYNKVNKNTVMLPSAHTVWLVGATI